MYSQLQPQFTHSSLTSTNTKHPHSQTPLHSCTFSYVHHALNNTHVLTITFLSIEYKHTYYHRHFPPHLSLSHTCPHAQPPWHTHTHTHTPTHTPTHVLQMHQPCVSAQLVWDPPCQTWLDVEGGWDPPSLLGPTVPECPFLWFRSSKSCRPRAPSARLHTRAETGVCWDTRAWEAGVIQSPVSLQL